MEESKNQKFRRLAQSRTDKIADELRKIGNLSRKTNYGYSSEDVKKIFLFIRGRVEDAEKEFDLDQKVPRLTFD